MPPFIPERIAALSPRLAGAPQRSEPSAPLVEVRPGQSLWDIAADHLGTAATDWEIAAEWPRWHAANAEEIGPDPAALKPGTVLSPPKSQI
ncbi:LysM peptidoglycan-binding domain-containing protein [Nesterenkonia sp. MY13]|uniref:LysM peptidoglycan-binding domain-containing protein n=1 Tax=Nesterenkonia sedimenti TaxID=1463632 RepID=A0A7X8TL86_9MICC|nr:LysM domain-containing protein [Nesterenkonia sedimenti]NLS10842.1 LysM peptidoglycan-binding domain-containing protein [Nesterenkonia sedimenti]